MKMIIAIVNRDDVSEVMSALTNAHFQYTRISTTGGFLKAGNSTLLIGVEDDKVTEVTDLIKTHSGSRTVAIPDLDYEGRNTVLNIAPAPRVTVGGATLFVMDVEKFVKM